jgi:hypothetical protein
VIIRASGPGPAYACISRIGSEISNPRDPRNHMLLSDEQEQAYQQALRHVKANEIEQARDVLKTVFEWIKVEE